MRHGEWRKPVPPWVNVCYIQTKTVWPFWEGIPFNLELKFKPTFSERIFFLSEVFFKKIGQREIHGVSKTWCLENTGQPPTHSCQGFPTHFALPRRFGEGV